MMISASRCKLDDIQGFRASFLSELKAQFIHDKCHQYGWSDDYLFTIDGAAVGYGCVWGIDRRGDRDTIFEFYVLPTYRNYQSAFMNELIHLSGATTLECQTNDPNTSKVFFENAHQIEVQSILFHDSFSTNWSLADLALHDCSGAHDVTQERKLELKRQGEIVASGGLMLNYNLPYADVYVDVPERYRRQGFGSLLVQEAKRLAYAMGRVPVARCRVSNHSSKRMLSRAGFSPCGYWLVGKVMLDQ
jgi:GNAT superfamily N-acetyltransferase